jgi:hypothetical protein
MDDEVKRILDMVAAGRLRAAEAAALLEALGNATGDADRTDEQSASMAGNATGQVDLPSHRRCVPPRRHHSAHAWLGA